MPRRTETGFTLIELLIVVAIIAILAAIAVPNFLEAQTRSKTSRLYADMRTIRTGLESYVIDYNVYPETDFGRGVLQANAPGAGMHRLTTPVAYLTSVPVSPFREKNISTDPRHTSLLGEVLYVRAKYVPNTGVSYETDGNNNDVSDSYEFDRIFYLRQTSVATPEMAVLRISGSYMMKSVGPNNVDDRSGQAGFNGSLARLYDPTNGTVSAGDVVTFGDTSTVIGK